MTFGQRLRTLRTSKDLTQLQLAQMLNLSKANISKYESDNIEPNLETLSIIATIFDVTADYLIGKSNKVKDAKETDPSISLELEKLLSKLSNLTQAEIDKTIEFSEFLKTQRNPKS